MSGTDSSTTPENPQAFPYQDQFYIQRGLTKLEYFASQALAGLLANPHVFEERNQQGMVDDALNVADLMMAACTRREGQQP